RPRDDAEAVAALRPRFRRSVAPMNEGALARLELPAIRRLLAERTAFAPGRELAEALFPATHLREAERLQGGTAAARNLVRARPSSGLRGARAIRDAVRRG